MEIGKDILEKVGKPSMGVPEGYFDGLKTRLASIPSQREAVPSPWVRVRPYLAMAAGFAAILVAGNAILRNTALSQPSGTDPFESSYAEMITLTSPETLYDIMEYETEEISEEDIINYLIESGARPEQLAYAGDQQ